MVDVRYILTDEGMRYDVYSPARKIRVHILLPKGKKCKKLFVDGSEASFETELVGDSSYVNFCAFANEKISFEILF